MTQPAAGSKKRVLVVEDDPTIRQLLTRALETRYFVDAAGDGAAAITRLNQSPSPDLILCDVMMPGIDGYAVARHAKNRTETKNVPVIFLTAKSDPRDIITGIQAGAKHYITKPFKIDDLMKKVGKLLGVA